MYRLLVLFAFFAAPIAAQVADLQCKCRHIEADEYLCKCTSMANPASASIVVLPDSSSPQRASASGVLATTEALPGAAAGTSATSAPVPTAHGGTLSGERTASGATIYIGPRGGRYHISPSGKKVYERRRR